MSQRLPYLPALDGLRAVAVTAVVLYHLDLGWAGGGFLGVDLFFVISGFLITTLLLGEHATTGRIGLRGFWIRRFKRLVPPLVVMTAVTVAATRLFGLPEQWTSVRWDAAAALGYVANWRFVLAEQSYFETLLGPSPLRHTWSLAVEEQWYVVWPLVMIGLVAIAARARAGQWWVLGLVVASAFASAAWMAVLYVADDPSRVYYGTDTRAQQLLIGAALAWLVRLRPHLAELAGRTVGAAAIGGGLVLFALIASRTSDDAAWLYRGGFLAVSVLCAVLVLGTTATHLALPLRWLSWRPLVWIGLRSYSIYLWHWPVIVFVGPPMGVDLPHVALILLQLTVTLVLADASHRLVERPTRYSSWRPVAVVSAWSMAGVVAIAASFVVLQPPQVGFSTATVFRPTALAAAVGAETPTAPTRVLEALSDGGASDEGASDAGASDEGAGDGDVADRGSDGRREPSRPGPSEQGSSDGPLDVLILGDSTAAALWDRMGPTWSDRWTVQLMARLGCGVFDGVTLDADSDRGNPNPDACVNWRDEWAASMYAVDPDVAIVMVGAWEMLDHRVEGVDYRFPSAEWHDLVGGGIDDAIGIAARTGSSVVVMSLPCMEPSGDEDTTARTDPARLAAVNEMFAASAARRPGVVVADLGSVLCPDGQPIDTIDGERVRYDGVHVSATGSDHVWQWLTPQLDALVD